MAETSGVREVENLPPLKRRKTRKGTQSCWECKRRKIRCTFVNPTESICDGCKSRRVRCISQEFHNEVKMADRTADRLDRVEALVEKLAKRAGSDLPGLLRHDTQNARTKGMNKNSMSGDKRLPLASPDISVPGTPSSSSLTAHASSRYDELCGALLAVWPSQGELDLMTNVPVGISVLFHGIVCMPYSSFLRKDMPSPREMFKLPPPGSHPVSIARKFLMLGSFLQGIPPGAVEDLGSLRTKYPEVRSRVVEAASRLVTSNDELVCSLEGIECIMIESMYQNNAGNLRQAWLTNRRAMAIAQMMGLHRGDSSLSSMLDVKTRDRIDPEYMWLRLVTSDRYLCLLLGLPQGSRENPFASPKALESCAPMERMERMEAVVGGLILQRDRKDLHNLEATREIEQLLQDAALSMSAQWWLIPDVATITGFDTNAFSETIRIISQFVHYHLLTQLHLPYMLQSSADSKYEYSKITAVNASREILSRFVLLRASTMIAAYCRGVDFLAFIASTTLCLAHIEVHRQYKTGVNNCVTAFHFLVHQRLSDRGLMERTLQSMEKMAQIDSDAIACKIASILQRLLTIEEAAANGVSYSASFSSENDDQGLLRVTNGNDSGDTLCINIPYFGTIKIGHGGTVRYVAVARGLGEENAWPNSASKASQSGKGFCPESIMPPSWAEQPSRWETSPASVRPSECQIGDQSVLAGCQAVPTHLNFQYPTEEFQATTSDEVGEAADADDCALQGVDMALFDNLFEAWKT